MEAASDTALDIKESILDAVGDTPLVRLSRLGAALKPQLVAKVEALNPGGSIKDRAAIALIEAAERDGNFSRVAPSSTHERNTGGLASPPLAEGLPRDRGDADKMFRRYRPLRDTARVVVARATAAGSPKSYYRVAYRLSQELPGAFQPNQYRNQATPPPTTQSTPELCASPAADHPLRGWILPGGTSTGRGTCAAETRDPDHRADNRTIYSSDEVKPTWSRVGGTLDGLRPSIVARYIAVSDRESSGASPLAETEGILPAVLWLALARTNGEQIDDPAAMVAVILPDGDVLPFEIYTLLDAPVRLLERDTELTVDDVLRRKHDEGGIPPLLTVATHAKVRDAVSLLHEHRVSQLPVVSGHDPHAVVGSVSERGLLRHAIDDPALLGAEIIEVMEAPFPAVSAEDGVRAAVELLARREALLVNMDGRAAGILTRADLLESLAR